jgi:hypothetical protein
VQNLVSNILSYLILHKLQTSVLIDKLLNNLSIKYKYLYIYIFIYLYIIFLMETILNNDVIEIIYSKVIYNQSFELLEEIKKHYKIKKYKSFIIKYWNIWAINIKYNYNDKLWQYNSENLLYYISRIHYLYTLNIKSDDGAFIILPQKYYNDILNILNKKDKNIKIRYINIFINKYLLILSNNYIKMFLQYIKKFKKNNIYTLWYH